MLYDSSNNVLKNGSLTSKVYFLLLKAPLTVSEISKLVYNGKVQLAHINKIMDVLEKQGYVYEYYLSREERREKQIDLRCKYWRANYKPMIEYSIAAIDRRKKDSPSSRKENLSNDEIKLFDSVLTSKWFSSFYDDDFLKTQHGEVILHNKTLLSDCPTRYLAFMLEELFSIRLTLQKFINFNIFYGNDKISFDDFCEKNKSLISENIKQRINIAFKKAKKYLGNYTSTNTALDYYMRDYYILFIPYELSEKLSSIGRVPLTVFLAFNAAVKSTR